MSPPRPQPGIMQIAPYVGGEGRLQGHARALKLSSNENPHGPSPKAMAAFTAAAADLALYPSTDHADLRAAIAEVQGLDPARIICGAGSDEILTWIAQGYAGPGDEVLYTAHGFGMYRIVALGAGATPVVAPESERRIDVDRLLAAVTPKTRVVFIANPANPTGTMLSQDELTRIADGLPSEALLVLDGAYAEFAEGYDGGLALVETHENAVMTRTFSKIHGLGGLRIGWGYGSAAVIGVLNRLRGPFNLSGAALAAATAAMRDTDHVARCRAENARQRDRLAAALGDLGIPSDPSHANFILARFKDEAEAAACDAYLRASGIIVRRVAGYGFPAALRITVGNGDGCDSVIAAIAEFRKGQDRWR